MDDIDRTIINHLQHGFPICDSPYQKIADELGLTESELIERLEKFLIDGILSRFGPMYHAEAMGGALTLAALQVPEQQFDEIVDIVNAFPEVAHNYARNHNLNMWFVIATETPERIVEVIQAIEDKTGFPVFNLPKQKEYFVELKLEA